MGQSVDINDQIELDEFGRPIIKPTDSHQVAKMQNERNEKLKAAFGIMTQEQKDEEERKFSERAERESKRNDSKKDKSNNSRHKEDKRSDKVKNEEIVLPPVVQIHRVHLVRQVAALQVQKMTKVNDKKLKARKQKDEEIRQTDFKIVEVKIMASMRKNPRIEKLKDRVALNGTHRQTTIKVKTNLKN